MTDLIVSFFKPPVCGKILSATAFGRNIPVTSVIFLCLAKKKENTSCSFDFDILHSYVTRTVLQCRLQL